MKDLFFLTCGTLWAPAFVVGPSLRTSGFRATSLSTTVAVVVRDDDSIVLVDSGWSEESCAFPLRSLGVAGAYVGMKIRREDAIVAQLRTLGLDPAQVSTIIATHMHYDHVGGVVDFPNAEVVCSDRELTAYREHASLGYRAADLARVGRVRTLALSSEPTYGFPASSDLFGDGEIVLLDACGHTRGAIAVALRSASRAYVHVGDAVYQRWEYGLSPEGPSLLGRLDSSNRAASARTYAAIRACEADPRRPTIVASHDQSALASLPRRPKASADADISRGNPYEAP